MKATQTITVKLFCDKNDQGHPMYRAEVDFLIKNLTRGTKACRSLEALSLEVKKILRESGCKAADDEPSGVRVEQGAKGCKKHLPPEDFSFMVDALKEYF